MFQEHTSMLHTFQETVERKNGFLNPCPKLDFRGVFVRGQKNCQRFSLQKRIFLKTKKAGQKHCENWRRESVQNVKKHPQRASEVSGQNCCKISSLKF